jgi:pheromone shutdown protein TraB
MLECAAVADALRDDADPRLTEADVRCVPAPDGAGAVLLVGVVHDHPASVARVAALLADLEPDVLALELPPLAMPLFRLYARDAYTPPRLGGEMSAAMQAADRAATVGIDGPNRTYLRRLVGRLAADRPSLDVLSAVLRDVGTGFGQALACRLGAVVGSLTPLRPRVYEHLEYDCSLLDTPGVQAAHEDAHVSQRRAFMGAVEVPPETQLVDDVREESMVAELAALRRRGDVVAVVGMEHLDPVHAGLTGAGPSATP